MSLWVQGHPDLHGETLMRNHHHHTQLSAAKPDNLSSTRGADTHEAGVPAPAGWPLAPTASCGMWRVERRFLPLR